MRLGNVNMPTGALYGPSKTLTVMADGQLTRAQDYRAVVVTYRGGQPVRGIHAGRAQGRADLQQLVAAAGVERAEVVHQVAVEAVGLLEHRVMHHAVVRPAGRRPGEHGDEALVVLIRRRRIVVEQFQFQEALRIALVGIWHPFHA